jgi:branched-chain amino acid transport system substrate-binding protein
VELVGVTNLGSMGYGVSPACADAAKGAAISAEAAGIKVGYTGLKATGSNPSQASYINTMLGITSYNAAGLWDGHSTSFARRDRGQAEGADNCLWIMPYQGLVFKLISGAHPICGSVIPGKKV